VKIVSLVLIGTVLYSGIQGTLYFVVERIQYRTNTIVFFHIIYSSGLLCNSFNLSIFLKWYIIFLILFCIPEVYYIVPERLSTGRFAGTLYFTNLFYFFLYDLVIESLKKSRHTAPQKIILVTKYRSNFSIFFRIYRFCNLEYRVYYRVYRLETKTNNLFTAFPQKKKKIS